MGGAEGLGDKGEGMRKVKLAVTAHEAVEYSTGDAVNDTALSVDGAQWVLD